MDRNDHYGGESSSLNLTQLWKFFRGDDNPPETLGSSKEYNVDMIPKIYKVPATDVEALKSPLMGLFEKRCARKFFIYVQDYEDDDPKSHQGLDLNKITARDLITKYGLEDDTIDFIGHALALYNDDSYLDQPAMDFVKRMKVEFDDGKAVGVTSEGEIAKCKKVVCDPSYLPDKVRKVGKVARAICITSSHPIPDTKESHSAQVILPQKQLGRKSDISRDR